jgi:hypothetical protein
MKSHLFARQVTSVELVLESPTSPAKSSLHEAVSLEDETADEVIEEEPEEDYEVIEEEEHDEVADDEVVDDVEMPESPPPVVVTLAVSPASVNAEQFKFADDEDDEITEEVEESPSEVTAFSLLSVCAVKKAAHFPMYQSAKMACEINNNFLGFRLKIFDFYNVPWTVSFSNLKIYPS